LLLTISKEIILKIEKSLSVIKTRSIIKALKNDFEVNSKNKSIKIIVDVDPM
jgi:hypothetical protein